MKNNIDKKQELIELITKYGNIEGVKKFFEKNPEHEKFIKWYLKKRNHQIHNR